MTYTDYIAAIKKRYQTYIVQGSPPLVSFFPNDKFAFAPDVDPWSRVTFLQGEAHQVSNGAPGKNRFRTSGILVVQVFVPSGTGSSIADKIAITIRDTFTAVTDTGVTFRTAQIIPVGVSGNLWQVNVSCPFFFDEFK